jgi:hypothetical protein
LEDFAYMTLVVILARCGFVMVGAPAMSATIIALCIGGGGITLRAAGTSHP